MGRTPDALRSVCAKEVQCFGAPFAPRIAHTHDGHQVDMLLEVASAFTVDESSLPKLCGEGRCRGSAQTTVTGTCPRRKKFRFRKEGGTLFYGCMEFETTSLGVGL